MARKPSPVCRVCQRKNCTEHKPKARPWQGGVSGRGRVERKVPNHERRRRHAFVSAWIAEHGRWCPGCGAVDYHEDGQPVVMTADHIIPVSEGGPEDGPLQARCYRCQRRQGAELRNRQRKSSNWRPHSSKPHRMGGG